jgi:plastocyanin
MDKTMFYALGITLVVAALVVSAIGLKFENFPSSRGVLVGVLMVFAALVGATAVFAVRNAQKEQADQIAEKAAETTSTPTGTTGATTTTSSTSTTPTNPSAGPGGTVKISADPTGQLAFQQKSVSSKPGSVTVDFTNQSPVGHDVRIEDSSGTDLGGTDLVTNGSTSATVDLQAGTYTFYCNVTGHQQAGMEGTLTVK